MDAINDQTIKHNLSFLKINRENVFKSKKNKILTFTNAIVTHFPSDYSGAYVRRSTSFEYIYQI